MSALRTITFTRARETKRTAVFEEDTVHGVAPSIGTLYLQKHTLEALDITEKLGVVIGTPEAFQAGSES